MVWAGVLRQVLVAIRSLPRHQRQVEEISPHWGTSRPLPLSHLLSPLVLVPISSPIQVSHHQHDDEKPMIEKKNTVDDDQGGIIIPGSYCRCILD